MALASRLLLHTLAENDVALDVEAFARRVETYGSIDPEKWQDITPDPDALPDYVTDPYRPEFN